MDSDTYIRLLARTNHFQCMEIARVYEEAYGTSLVKVIEGKIGHVYGCSGGFATLCALMLMPKADRFAYLLHKAMDGWGTSNKAIIHILGFQSKTVTDEMAARYDDMYGVSLEQSLDDEIGLGFPLSPDL